MIRILISVCGVLILSSCTSHYYKVHNNNVYIYLNDPGAEEVLFVCSLDRFKPHETIKNNQGVWEITLPSDLEFRYFFIVDGEVYTPACNRKEKDDFGSENCIYEPGR